MNTRSVLVFFKTFIQFLFKKWVVIFLTTFLFGLMGALYNWLQKPDYTAEMTFALEDSGGDDLGGYANLAMQLGLSIGNSSSGVFKGDNLFELMKSRFILEKTLLTEANVDGVNDLLVNHYLRIIKKGEGFQKKGMLPNPYFSNNPKKFTLVQDSILNTIQMELAKKCLSVSRVDKKLSIISVKVRSHNQFFAVEFCEKLVNNVTTFYVETITKKQLKNVQVLERQADSIKNLMSGSINEVALANDVNVNPIMQIGRTRAQKKSIDVTVYTMAYGEVLKNLELSRISLLKETPLIQMIDKPRLPLQNLKKGRLNGFLQWSIISFLLLLPILITWFNLSITQKNQDT